MPLVTVILSTYNWSTVLPTSIESVLGQSFKDFELLVIGDGCTDDSTDVVARYTDPRVHWINLPRNNGGQFAPNNEGLRQAKGKYVAYIGHDDIWSPFHLENLTALCAGRDDVYVAGGIVWFDEQSKVLFLSGLDKSIDVPEVRNWRINPSGNMHSLSLVAKNGWWKNHSELSDKTTDHDFFDRLEQICPSRFAGKFSVAKIPAAFRKNIYKRLDTTPQQNIFRALKENPLFLDDAAILFLAKVAAKNQPRAIDWGTLYKKTKNLAGGLGYRYLRQQFRTHVLGRPLPEKNVTIALRKFKGLE